MSPGRPRSPFLFSNPASPCFRTSSVWEAGTEKQSCLSYQRMDLSFWREEREWGRFTGEIKSKKCQSVQAMLQGTGRTPYLHFGLSL